MDMFEQQNKFGLDNTFIECCVQELLDGETIQVFGCTDVQGFVDYLIEDLNMLIDAEEDEFFVTITPLMI